MISNGYSDLGRSWTTLFVLISIGFVAGGFLFCASEMNYLWQQKSLEIKTFPGNQKDKIAVVLAARGEEAALSVSDAGTDFPDSIELSTTRSLGLQFDRATGQTDRRIHWNAFL